MNTANIKKYAPKARNNFIAAVTKQAARYGITAKGVEPMEQRGNIALIGENALPKAIAPARKALERMVEQMGFAQAWSKRLTAGLIVCAPSATWKSMIFWTTAAVS